MRVKRIDTPLQKLFQNGRKRKLPKGQIIHVTEDRMMFNEIVQGFAIRYSIRSDGSKSIQAIYGPGDMFPLTPVFKNIFDALIYHGPEVFYYETITEATLYSIGKDALLESLANDPMIYKDLLYVSGTRLSSNIYRLESVSLDSAYSRVCHMLAYLSDTFGEEAENGTTIPFPLTHQLLASILNLARETVSTCIGRLQDKDIVTSGRKIIIKDLEKLKNEVR